LPAIWFLAFRWCAAEASSSLDCVIQSSSNSSGMIFEVCRVICADHPSLPGHFPGAPLVPGVVILDEVLEALIEWRQNAKLTGIRTVKFLAPLKPEHPFTICLSADDPRLGEVNFCCRAEDRVIVEGRLEVVWEAT
jgi:3-hydroxymyristoyl/3-hydroxydecanoyl-(acyl carrier protein) dehydratase